MSRSDDQPGCHPEEQQVMRVPEGAKAIGYWGGGGCGGWPGGRDMSVTSSLHRGAGSDHTLTHPSVRGADSSAGSEPLVLHRLLLRSADEIWETGGRENGS